MSLRGRWCPSPEAISNYMEDCFVRKNTLLAMTLFPFYIPELIQHILIVAPVF